MLESVPEVFRFFGFTTVKLSLLSNPIPLGLVRNFETLLLSFERERELFVPRCIQAARKETEESLTRNLVRGIYSSVEKRKRGKKKGKKEGEKIMLMPASLTRSRSREFLAGAASEPLQPRSLPIQRTLVKKHMYYPRGEIPTLFPIVHLFHSKPSHNFFSRWRNRTRGDVMTFFPERNYLDDRSPFLSKPISYFFATRFGYRSPLIVSIIRFDSLLLDAQFIPRLYRKMCPFTIKRVSSESIAVGTWQSVGNMSYLQVSLRLICFRYYVDNPPDAVPAHARVGGFSNLKRSARKKYLLGGPKNSILLDESFVFLFFSRISSYPLFVITIFFFHNRFTK